MRVFVVSTGRCGSTTFSKACQFISNYTVAHQWHHGQVGNYEYPDDHIEVDPRLSYSLPLLIEKYPTAKYIHLQRERESCIKSLSKRKSTGFFMRFHFGAIDKNLQKGAEVYYDITNSLINKILLGANSQTIHVWLENLISLDYENNDWQKIWNFIKAQGNFKDSLAQWKIKYNITKTKRR